MRLTLQKPSAEHDISEQQFGLTEASALRSQLRGEAADASRRQAIADALRAEMGALAHLDFGPLRPDRWDLLRTP